MYSHWPTAKIIFPSIWQCRQNKDLHRHIGIAITKYECILYATYTPINNTILSAVCTHRQHAVTPMSLKITCHHDSHATASPTRSAKHWHIQLYTL